MLSNPFPPHMLQEIAATKQLASRLDQRWPQEIVLKDQARSSIYDHYPYLFLPAFPSLELEAIRPLTVAGRLFASTLFLADNLIDQTAPHQTASVLQMLALQAEGYGLLHQMFPPQARFWDRWRSYLAQYVEACLHELCFASAAQPYEAYTEALALRVIMDKTGVARATIAGLVELAGDDGLLETLCSAINEFNIAYQMLDDLQDWKEDLRCGLPSLLLARVVAGRPPNNDEAALNALTATLSRELYYGGHAGYVLDIALGALDTVDRLTAELPPLPLGQVTAGLRRSCDALRRDIDRIVGSNLERARTIPKVTLQLPEPRHVWQALAWDSLHYVLGQWQSGYGEARHIMVFPHQQGFSARDEHQYGDTFQRALITDVLCQANDVLGGQLQPVINGEIGYLLGRRQLGGFGGWSYFPDLPELPPDIDDLAQVMQVCLGAGRRDAVDEYCLPALRVALQGAHDDGSLETWILPAVRTPDQERQAEWVRNAWGSGPDVDVMANLLYALTIYDRQGFVEPIERGVAYITRQQRDDGSWTSSWYHGPYYGTFVCLRLLVAIAPHDPAIGRALSFLRRRQQENGGWGIEANHDPLNTALALLGLAVARNDGRRQDNERAARGLAQLQRMREERGAWPACSFIRMELGRAQGNVRQVLSYGSRTITSMFVLKAALAWSSQASAVCSEQVAAR